MRKVKRVGTLEGVGFVLANWDVFRENGLGCGIPG